jgi:class 3 adenylate cyclase
MTIEQNVEDAIGVLDDLGTERAVAFGWNVSSAPTLLFAADHPNRTSGLILANGNARLTRAPDYPMGFPEELLATTADQTTSTAGSDQFDFLTTFAPSVATDDRFRAWWDQAGHRGASPARSRQLWQLLITADVRDALPRITAPTLVLTRSGLADPSLARYVAEHIADARYVEFPGSDLMWWVGDSDSYIDQIETFLASVVGSAPRARRSLATVLFIDVVGSTERASALGDRRWRDLLATYHELVRREVDRHTGDCVKTEGDGVLATFSMPADAIRCAVTLTGQVRALDFDIRAGIHTGEIEMLSDDVAGIGVHIAARVLNAAAPGEVLVSRTVADLVTGSGFVFDDRGEHDLKGVPGRWGLFAVKA